MYRCKNNPIFPIFSENTGCAVIINEIKVWHKVAVVNQGRILSDQREIFMESIRGTRTTKVEA